MSAQVKTGETLVVEFTTSNPTTGAAADADSLPTGTLVVDGVDDAATVTVANKGTGVYTASVTLPTLADGDVVQIRIAATVGGVAGKGAVWSGQGATARPADVAAAVAALNDFDPAADTVNANIVQIGGDSTAADNLESYCDGTTPIPANVTQQDGQAFTRTLQAGTTASLTLAATEPAIDDSLAGWLVWLAENTGAGQLARITDYVGATRVATVVDATTGSALATAPDDTTTYQLLPPSYALNGGSGLDAAGVRDALGLASANLDTQLAALPTAAETADAVWDEAQSGHATAGTFGAYLDSSVSGVSTGGVSAADIADAVWDEATAGHVGAGSFGALMPAIAGYIDTEVAAIQSAIAGLNDFDPATDTVANVTTVATLTDKAGFSLATAPPTAAEVAAAVRTGTAMAESYAADGSAPTLEQALFMILQRLTEFEVSGTSITVKRLDGTTSAFVLTTDSATTPTSSTRGS